MMIAILIALLFLAPGAALAVVMPPPDDCDDEVHCYIRDATPDMAGCWTMECIKQELIDSCELEQQPEYVDCNNILRCFNNVTDAQSEYCAGNGYPAIVFRKI